MALKFVKVATMDDVPPGTVKGVKPAPGYHVALCNVAGSVYAIDDACTHEGGMLHFGELTGERIQCPVHLAIFDIKTGAVMEGPAREPIDTYPVRVDGSQIEVGVEV